MAHHVHALYNLRQWPAAYYLPSDKKWLAKKWVPGRLSVNITGIRFTYELEKESHVLQLRFADFVDMKKATSTLIFPTLVIVTKDGLAYWFSSLPDRDVALTVIQHFWKQRLLEQPGHAPGREPPTRTALGSELLRLTHDSEQTLQRAGTALRQQGEQLSHVLGMIYDMNSDLDAAERLLAGFESWTVQWRLPPVHHVEPVEVISARSVPTVYDFPIVFSEDASRAGVGLAVRDGTLRISPEGLTLLDKDHLHIHHYKRRDVSALRVKSPWEMTVSKYLIGQPDVSYSVMSTYLPQMLTVLQPVYGDRMDLVDPPCPLPAPDLSPALPSGDPDGSYPPSPDVKPLPLDTPALLVSPGRDGPPCTALEEAAGGAGGGSQKQEQKRMLVSDREAQELQDIMSRMKQMATSICNEQDMQLEQIDQLTEKVVLTNDRVKADTKRIKEL